MPEDAKEPIGHGVRAKRSKSGAVSFDLLSTGEASHAPLPSIHCQPGGRLGQGPGRTGQSGEVAGGNHSAGWSRCLGTVIPPYAAVERTRYCAQDLGSARDRNDADHGDRPSGRTLIEGLATDYEADRATIVTDVQNLLGHMAKHDLVSIGRSPLVFD
jgi:hypothetical protein